MRTHNYCILSYNSLWNTQFQVYPIFTQPSWQILCMIGVLMQLVQLLHKYNRVHFPQQSHQMKILHFQFQLLVHVFSMVLVVDSQTTTAFLVFFLFHLFLCWLSFMCFGFSFFRLLITAFFKFLNLCKCIRFCYGFTSHNRSNISSRLFSSCDSFKDVITPTLNAKHLFICPLFNRIIIISIIIFIWIMNCVQLTL